MKKLGIRLLALTLLATVTTGCASSKQENTWDKIKEKKEIVIGTEHLLLSLIMMIMII